MKHMYSHIQNLFSYDQQKSSNVPPPRARTPFPLPHGPNGAPGRAVPSIAEMDYNSGIGTAQLRHVTSRLRGLGEEERGVRAIIRIGISAIHINVQVRKTSLVNSINISINI